MVGEVAALNATLAGAASVMGAKRASAFFTWLGVDTRIAKKQLEAQSVRDLQAMQSAMIAEIAASEDSLDEKEKRSIAVNQMTRRVLREQDRRVEIGLYALSDLRDKPASDGQGEAGPTEEWYERFDRFAMNATNEGLKAYFGKALAGELRKTGSFSFLAMHILSILDERTGSALLKALSATIDGEWLPFACHNILTPEELHLLFAAGILTHRGVFEQRQTKVQEGPKLHGMPEYLFALSDLCDGRRVAAFFDTNLMPGPIQPGQVRAIPQEGYYISEAGREILRLGSATPALEVVVEHYRRMGAYRLGFVETEMINEFDSRILSTQDIPGFDIYK